MKIVLYATGAFVSPETLYWEDKGALTINLFFSFHCPSANNCISILEQKCRFPRHSLSFHRDFYRCCMFHEGVATILYPVTLSVAFEWQAQDLDAKSQRRLSSRSSWLLGRCIIVAALKLPMGLSHVLSTKRLASLSFIDAIFC